MSIIRLDMITERDYSHVVVIGEDAACKAIDEYMQKNEISYCSMASKDDLIAVNAEIAEVFDDAANYNNYIEWHDITTALRKQIVHLLTETDMVSDEELLGIAEVLEESNLDINEVWEDETI